MNETMDIMIDEWIREFIDTELKVQPSIELKHFIELAFKSYLVPEINAHYHGHILYTLLSTPAQIIYKRWEDYYKDKTPGK